MINACYGGYKGVTGVLSGRNSPAVTIFENRHHGTCAGYPAC